MASPKCQYILNEIVYFKWPHWQNMRRAPKIALSFIQLFIVIITSWIYIPLRLAGKCRTCERDDENWWKYKLYEHPYCKFINHTTWYLVFLSLVIATSFEQDFATTKTGLVYIGKSHDSSIGIFLIKFVLENCFHFVCFCSG